MNPGPTIPSTRSPRGRGAPAAGVALALLVGLGTVPAAPAPVSAQPPPGQPPPARSADVETLDAIMAAVYGVISGPAGEERDWDRFRSLFIEGARLIPAGAGADGGFGHRVMTPDDFATLSGPNMERQGFFEREIHRTVERYGPVVHAFSTYESRRSAADAEPFARGINSFQLLNDGTRWWVVTIFWHGETPATPIPGRYLGGGG